MSSLSREEGEQFLLVPPYMTWEHVLKTVEDPTATVELETPPMLAKESEPEPARVPKSSPRVNLFPQPMTNLEAIEVVDLEEEEA